ncbi:MAG: hypothetical protein IJO34_07335 [Akkermansia sp.]|nr:hypothetical protein [Akkermansia sp.]
MTIQHHDTITPVCGKKGNPSRYRFITLVAPMAPHDTLGGRQHNMKLYCVLRWFLYGLPPGSRFFCVPKPAEPMPYGAQCIRALCSVSRETFLGTPWFQELLCILKTEKLTPCLYMFDGYADGKDKPMPTIDIIGYARRKKLHVADIVVGRGLDRAHIPYFAHQMLLNMKKATPDSMPTEEKGYYAHFGLNPAQFG